MSELGKYLYGFSDGGFKPGNDLRGLAGAPVQSIEFQDIAALVSDHAAEKLQLFRRNLEPHHRVVQECSRLGTFIPMSFGHVVEDEQQIRQLLCDNYLPMKAELKRLAGKVEMRVKLLWDVDNIFEYFVNRDPKLRNRRDRVFGKSWCTPQEKLELGSFFEERLNQERERLGKRIVEALQDVVVEVRVDPPTDEKMVVNGFFLVDRETVKAFEASLYQAAGLFDSTFALDYGGPWAPYNFVRLRLEIGAPQKTRE